MSLRSAAKALWAPALVAALVAATVGLSVYTKAITPPRTPAEQAMRDKLAKAYDWGQEPSRCYSQGGALKCDKPPICAVSPGLERCVKLDRAR